MKYIWNNSYTNCSCRWKWRMIIAVGKKKRKKNQGFHVTSANTANHSSREDIIDLSLNGLLYSSVGRASHWYSLRSRVRNRLKPWFFQASSFQRLKLENLSRWSFFAFSIPHCHWFAFNWLKTSNFKSSWPFNRGIKQSKIILGTTRRWSLSLNRDGCLWIEIFITTIASVFPVL